MAEILLFNKPFRVLCQFRSANERATLATYIDVRTFPGVYPAGRLDYDSEGLIVLTADGELQHRITHPSSKMEKVYWVQVEGQMGESALRKLRGGLVLKDGLTRPAKARQIEPPALWPRQPPVRIRQYIPTSWIEITLREGRNRQVRRMTAAIGHPTLRLIRVAIGPWHLDDLMPGQYRQEKVHLPQKSRTKTR